MFSELRDKVPVTFYYFYSVEEKGFHRHWITIWEKAHEVAETYIWYSVIESPENKQQFWDTYMFQQLIIAASPSVRYRIILGLPLCNTSVVMKVTWLDSIRTNRSRALEICRSISDQQMNDSCYIAPQTGRDFTRERIKQNDDDIIKQIDRLWNKIILLTHRKLFIHL